MNTHDQTLKNLSVRVDALRRAMDAVINSSTPDIGKWVGYKDYARVYSALARKYVAISGDTTINRYDVDKFPDSLPWGRQKRYFEIIYTATLILSAILSKFDSGVSSSVSEIQDLLAANLRKVIYTKPEREIEVQNAIESLLVGRGYQKGVHYDRESGKIKFSGKEFIPDFVFLGYNTALEVKLIKEHAHISKCVEEMSADIPAYLSVYGNLLFCVYDLGAVRDVAEFQEGIQKQKGVRICVIKH